MANDYIPSDDAGLSAWANNFHTQVNANYEDLGFTALEMTELNTLKSAFATSLATHALEQNTAQYARAQKDAMRATLVSALRSYVKRVQASPATTDAYRVQMGITVPDTTPTAVAAPTSQPVLFINTSNRLQHIVQFTDSMTPLSKAKPAGALGCEIYRKVGGVAPSSVAECEFLGLDSASPYIVNYEAAQGGQMVHYIGRWATRSGLVGPTSDVIGATVVA